MRTYACSEWEDRVMRIHYLWALSVIVHKPPVNIHTGRLKISHSLHFLPRCLLFTQIQTASPVKDLSCVILAIMHAALFQFRKYSSAARNEIGPMSRIHKGDAMKCNAWRTVYTLYITSHWAALQTGSAGWCVDQHLASWSVIEEHCVSWQLSSMSSVL